MTIKISRVSQDRESYNITVDWISNFANQITKDAQIIEVFRNQRSEKFATIEEKMADMKARVGFSNVSKVNIKTSIDKSACGDSPCDECASKSDSKNTLNKLKSIINYVKKTKENRPDISYMQVLADCRELPEYKDISQKISHDKFKEKVKSIIGNGPDYTGEIEYVPYEEAHQLSFSDDMNAPYMPKL